MTETTKRCRMCERDLEISRFSVDRYQKDGRVGRCKECDWIYKHRNYDRQLARYHVWNMIRSGKIPHPRTLRCSNCGGRATMYHHWLGHSREHWEHVIPVCRPCNQGRAYEQRAMELA